MTIGDAISYIKCGGRAWRAGWNGKGQYICLVDNVSYRFHGTVINPNHETMGNCAILFVGTSGQQVGWLASQSDLLSDDWCVENPLEDFTKVGD